MDMKILRKIVIGSLAVVGVFYLALVLFATLGICEDEVLSQSVSPNGNSFAKHIRTTCKGKIEVGLHIGSARPGGRTEETGRIIFRAESDRDKEYALSIKPFRLWWENDKRLHVEFPKRDSFDLGNQIGDVELEVRRIE
ncbi:MAG: hypothetical protein OEV08_13755 [Nitrospira sp.]|nr:hypothetical protein [Nitrospira sp.]